jgi:DNA-binding LacI/PurR family transcriptional regulator
MPREITIHDVARLARVSPSTVSNLLNGRQDRMRTGTMERVQQAIDRLSYTPSGLARQLKNGYAPIIGLVVPSVANPFWGAMARAVEETALAHEYRVLLGNSERDLERELAYAEDMFAHGIRGIIFGSSPLSLAYLGGLVERGLRIVAFDRHNQREDRFDIDSVGVDNVHAGQLATEHLLALGHRRIGFLSGPIRTVSRMDRLEGHRAALAEAAIKFDPRLVWEGAMSSTFGDIEGAQLGRVGAREILGIADRPTALLAINDMYALGACAGARDLGLRVPEDVSIVGCDDNALADIVSPPLTTIRQPLQDMTRFAVERLIGYLEKTSTESPSHLSLDPELIVRGSTTHPRHRPDLVRAGADSSFRSKVEGEAYDAC